MNVLRITVLAENTVRKRELVAEHGWALWLELGGKNILFDTGQGLVISSNSEVLGIGLANTDAVILSHGHYDHTGGLVEVCRRSERLAVYSHPAAFEPKYSRHADGGVHDAGMPHTAKDAAARKSGIKLNDSTVEVFSGLRLTGAIPRITDFENTGGDFFLDRNCQVPDLVWDDQAAFIDTPSGLVVILGCAHAGVINTLRHIRQLAGNRPVHTVVGGMHLGSATRERIDKTILELKRLGIKRLFPTHCTGFEAVARLRQKLRERCCPCDVGTVIEVEV